MCIKYVFCAKVVRVLCWMWINFPATIQPACMFIFFHICDCPLDFVMPVGKTMQPAFLISHVLSHFCFGDKLLSKVLHSSEFVV